MTDTQGRILDAAEELFAVRGYQGTTTRAIAEAAGVNEVTVFRTFGNKQGILRAIGERFTGSQAASVAGELDEHDVRAALLELARREVAGGLAHGALVTRLAFDATSIPEVAEVFAGGPQANLAALAEFVARAQRAGGLRSDVPAPVIAEAFFALTSSFVITRTVLGGGVEAPEDLEAVVGSLFELFWCGAAPAGARQEKKK